MRIRSLGRLTVTYADDFPGELIESVMEHVNGNLDILPQWLVLMHVDYDANLPDLVTAQMMSRVDYRRAYLMIGGRWPTEEEKYRAQVMRHEFVHVFVAPLHLVLSRTLNWIETRDKGVHDILNDDRQIAHEQVVVDLTELIERLIARIDEAEGVTPAPSPKRGVPCGHGLANKFVPPEERNAKPNKG